MHKYMEIFPGTFSKLITCTGSHRPEKCSGENFVSIMKAGRWGDITHTHTYAGKKNAGKAQLKWQQRTCTHTHTLK